MVAVRWGATGQCPASSVAMAAQRNQGCLPGRPAGCAPCGSAWVAAHLCPTTVWQQCWVSRSHTLTCSSLLALTRRRPPRSTNTTSVTCPRWPLRRNRPASAPTSHTTTSVSLEPEASSAPPREKRSADTSLRWPDSVAVHSPLPRSHSRTVPSAWPTATWSAAGEAAIWVTSPAAAPDSEGGGVSLLTCGAGRAETSGTPALEEGDHPQGSHPLPSAAKRQQRAAAHHHRLLHVPHQHVLQRRGEQVAPAVVIAHVASGAGNHSPGARKLVAQVRFHHRAAAPAAAASRQQRGRVSAPGQRACFTTVNPQ